MTGNFGLRIGKSVEPKDHNSGAFEIPDREVRDEDGHLLYTLHGAEKERELVEDKKIAVFIDPKTGKAIDSEAFPEAQKQIEERQAEYAKKASERDYKRENTFAQMSPRPHSLMNGGYHFSGIKEDIHE
jgi:hypothetical protein